MLYTDSPRLYRLLRQLGICTEDLWLHQDRLDLYFAVVKKDMSARCALLVELYHIGAGLVSISADICDVLRWMADGMKEK